MAIITSYPDDTTPTDNDKLLTSDSAGATRLMPLSQVNRYLGPGWTITGESWTYSSYSNGVGVINVPTGATTRYSIGMKVKFTQPTLGIKYGSIIGVATTALTVQFAGGTILSNEAITTPLYSATDAPNGYPNTVGEAGGAWQSWTPTWSSLTVGNGTVTAKFTQIGKTVHYRVVLIFGSTTSISGVVGLTMPLPATTYGNATNGALPHIGVARYEDVGVNGYLGVVDLFSSTVMRPLAIGSGSSFANLNGLNGALPFVWATGDEMSMTGTYEAA